MKTKLIIFAALLFIGHYSFGQLNINAGNDTIICVGVWGVDTTIIGGHPTAIGGTEPYIYSWKTNYTIGSNSFGASYFLDDSTKANPTIVNDAPQDLKFILTVSDSNGTQMSDSLNIHFSRFAYTLVYFFANINQGDTVALMHNIGLGTGPLSFSWTPNYNISDTSISNPEAWPEFDTDYEVIATDSIGCVSRQDVFEINVNPLGFIKNSESNYKSIVFPNPLASQSKIFVGENLLRNSEIKVIDVNGKVILSDRMDGDSYAIGSKINQAGLYLYVIYNDEELISTGQFVKD